MMKMELSHEPSNFSCGAVELYPRETVPQVCKEARVRRMSIAIVSAIVKDWKQSKCPTEGESRNLLW